MDIPIMDTLLEDQVNQVRTKDPGENLPMWLVRLCTLMDHNQQIYRNPFFMEFLESFF